MWKWLLLDRVVWAYCWCSCVESLRLIILSLSDSWQELRAAWIVRTVWKSSRCRRGLLLRNHRSYCPVLNQALRFAATTVKNWIRALQQPRLARVSGLSRSDVVVYHRVVSHLFCLPHGSFEVNLILGHNVSVFISFVHGHRFSTRIAGLWLTLMELFVLRISRGMFFFFFEVFTSFKGVKSWLVW